MSKEATEKESPAKRVQKLEIIAKEIGINLEDFYVIKIYKDGVQLQGTYTSETSERLNKGGFNSIITTLGYIEFNRENITIILT